MFIEENKLREFITDAGIVSQEELDSAKKVVDKPNASGSVGDYLVSEGVISEDELKRVQAYILGIPYIDVSQTKIPFETLSLIPEPIARKNNIVAYHQDEKTLEVAMLDTDNISAIDFIKKKLV
jgi:type IV pilus assembly protein PilB